MGDVTQCDCASGRLLKGDGLMVSTPYGFGRVDITDVSDHYVEKPFEKLRKLAKPTRLFFINSRLVRICHVVHIQYTSIISLRSLIVERLFDITSVSVSFQMEQYENGNRSKNGTERKQYVHVYELCTKTQ